MQVRLGNHNQVLPDLVGRPSQSQPLPVELCGFTDCTLTFTPEIQKLNIYQMFRCFGGFLSYIINKNVSYSNNKTLFKISSKIARHGLSGCPQSLPPLSSCLESRRLILQELQCPRSSWIPRPLEVLLKCMWYLTGSNFSFCPLPSCH